MHRWAGPRSMSLESLTSALPVTLLTPGWTTPLRLEIITTLQILTLSDKILKYSSFYSVSLYLYTQGRQNIAPDKIPWAALKTLMAQSIYGGRIDNEFDQRLLITFLDRIFTKGSFDSEFKLALKVDGHKDIKMPDGIRSVVF